MRLIPFLLIFVLFNSTLTNAQTHSITEGQQPNVGIDLKGTIRMAYGSGEKIFCMTSTDQGKHFSTPVLVANVPNMHIGHTRGPQIASSKDFSIITAIDKEGNIQSFRLSHAANIWTKLKMVNDAKKSAPEGLMALTADMNNNFYAAWLDLREKHQNNIYFSALEGMKSNWSLNKLVYKSPDEHVCECCKPNIYYNQNKLVISFRNWMMGSRDIYYTISINKGQTFSKPLKSGTGTWKLNGCPMDGGGLTISDNGSIAAAWQRNGDIFYCNEGQKEVNIGSGRGVSMAQANGTTVIAWKEKEIIKVKNLKLNTIKDVGTGESPRVYQLKQGKTFCVWEENKQVQYALLEP
ncbi:MAG: hypothetical protein JWN56_1895 [Sphingobacteriales bacterium]|nr:hypothetical protein [Sphingobacteriales bacterium]